MSANGWRPPSSRFCKLSPSALTRNTQCGDPPLAQNLRVCRRAWPEKRFVYILRSRNDPRRRDVGVTSDLDARFAAHNAGQNRSTTAWRPWDPDVTIQFRTEALALRFEAYLKSGSGHAFTLRHFT